MCGDTCDRNTDRQLQILCTEVHGQGHNVLIASQPKSLRYLSGKETSLQTQFDIPIIPFQFIYNVNLVISDILCILASKFPFEKILAPLHICLIQKTRAGIRKCKLRNSFLLFSYPQVLNYLIEKNISTLLPSLWGFFTLNMTCGTNLISNQFAQIETW